MLSRQSAGVLSGVAERNAQVRKINAPPRSTRMHSFGTVTSRVAYAGFVGAAIGWHAGVAFRVTILRPLPNIADHVVQTKSIRGLQSHGMSLPNRIVLVPGMIWRQSFIFTPLEAGACPRTRGILPV